MQTSVTRRVVCAILACACLSGVARAQTAPGIEGWAGVWVVPRQAFIAELPRLRDPKDPIAPQLTAEYAAMQASYAQGVRSIPRPAGRKACRT